MANNPQLDLAYEYVTSTDRNIFLTGKAGTGKTTFLHRIKAEAIKRMAVVAPTGVAAINAGGMTIHSLFQLPFGPIVPGMKAQDDRQRKFSSKKIDLLRSLDLLVIDEISMVRSDVLDGIDGVLRRYRGYAKPFGGVQLLMIGDLHQLPPVVRQEEWELLRPHYDTSYFFGSLALRKTNPVTLELKHIYRQSDQQFIALLNKVRDNQLDAEVLEKLNSRYRLDFQPAEEEGYITLTSHNAAAQEINAEKLAALAGELHVFKAKISGNFPAHSYPTDEVLDCKVGAQVMFVKNDVSPEKLYFNGKIGQVARIDGKTVYVKCPDDQAEIAVEAVEWTNIKYTLNEKTKEVEGENLGTFTQYPLKLAWAITIHKSQGLTFERAIIDAQAAFAHGQVYVALSRCKSFEGVVLRSKISFGSVKTDSVVKRHSEEAEKNAPTEDDLTRSKQDFQQKLVLELFDFTGVERALHQLERTFLEHESSLQGAPVDRLQALAAKAETEVLSVAKNFRQQLLQLLDQPELPEENPALQARIKQAGTYFLEKLNDGLLSQATGLPVASDNQAVAKKATEKKTALQRELFIKNACLTACQAQFSMAVYIRAKANADLDFLAAPKKTPGGPAFDLGKSTPHPALFGLLAQWREEVAAAFGKSSYEVLPLRSLAEIVQYLPTSTATLQKIKGFGDYKIKTYGADVIGIVERYCREHGVATDQLGLQPAKPVVSETKLATFDLFRQGKSIDEIATERGFVRTTIEGHLAHFVRQGELPVTELLEPEKVEELTRFFAGAEEVKGALAKEHFGEKYSYGEIRLVVAHLASLENGQGH